MLGLGLGLTGDDDGGGGSSPSTTSQIQINVAGGNPTSWQSVGEVLIYDSDGTEIFQALTPIGESATGFGDLSAGQFTSNSTDAGADSVACLNDTFPDIGSPSDNIAVIGKPVEWSSNNSTELIIFIKLAEAAQLIGGGKIYLCTNISTTYGYNPATATFDFDGVQATPTTAPTDKTDVYQTTGNPNFKWFEWIF